MEKDLSGLRSVRGETRTRLVWVRARVRTSGLGLVVDGTHKGLTHELQVQRRLDGQRRWSRRLRRRLARAPEAVLGAPCVGLTLGVPSCPEPPGAPLGGAGAELGQ
eukprot:scaffold72311_cov68-Phaeocystis_antarctica.AAC.4